MKKLTILHKISYSALFIALSIILSRFFSIPGLFGLPFLKISLSVSVVIFSSLYLGPVYGAIVGFSSDLIGALLFPQGGAYDFLYSIPAFLQGLMPFFFYKILDKLKVDKKYPIFLSIIFLLFMGFIIYFVLTHDTFSYTATGKKYEFTPLLKILIPTIFCLFGILFIGIMVFINYKFKDRKLTTLYKIYLVATSVFLTYVLIKIPLSSWILSYRLNYTYEIIFGVRTIAGFLTGIIHTLIILVALEVTVKLNIPGELIKKDIQYGKEESK